MKKQVKSYFKNEKGLTLVELLAVVVILGIIAAIAVPSIGALINNSKKDAQVANAEQMVSSAKLMLSSNVIVSGQTVAPTDQLSTGVKYTLKQMIDEGYIEKFENPFGGTIADTTSYVEIKNDENGKTTYSVYLAPTTGNIGAIGTATAPDEISTVDRDSVDVD